MTPIKLSEAGRMEYARLLAAAAACLDCIQSHKSSPASLSEALLEAPAHVANLQQVAHLLAGDRADEIFAPEDSADAFTEEAQAHFLQRFREVC